MKRINSNWDARCSWPEELPVSIEDSKELVRRLRRMSFEDTEEQNMVDKACHLIEQLHSMIDDRDWREE